MIRVREHFFFFLAKKPMVLVFMLETRPCTALKKLSTLAAPKAHNISATKQLRARML